MNNKPLTFNELTHMDGEPVWVEYPSGENMWKLVIVENGGDGSNDVTLMDYVSYDSRYISALAIFNAGAKVYKQKPNDSVEMCDKLLNSGEKVQRHKELCDALNELYERKNHDYGDSFHETFKEEGFAMARIRLSDKLNRFKTLSRNAEQQVVGESMRDTLIDLANYALMTVLELDELAGINNVTITKAVEDVKQIVKQLVEENEL